jgi:hypothetical protein
MKTVSTILATAAVALSVIVAPGASAAGPCAYVGTAEEGAHAQECTSCLNSHGNSPNSAMLCGKPYFYRPTCAQGVVCGNAFRTEGPCQYAGTAQGGGANGQACQACVNSLMPNPQAPNLCGAPPPRGPACEQAGVCGNAYRTAPACPPNAPIADCVPPGTFPTPAFGPTVDPTQCDSTSIYNRTIGSCAACNYGNGQLKPLTVPCDHNV